MCAWKNGREFCHVGDKSENGRKALGNLKLNGEKLSRYSFVEENVKIF